MDKENRDILKLYFAVSKKKKKNNAFQLPGQMTIK